MRGDSGYAYLPAGQAEVEFGKYEQRIRQLEELNRVLSAEVDRQRLVVEAVNHWLLSKGAPARAIALSEAYDTYQASKPK